MKEQNNEHFFVEIRHSSDIRRNILETLKGILEILQRFEKFKHLRHKKLENIQRLRVFMKETNKMFGTLKLKLPQTSLSAVVMREHPAPQAHQKEPIKKGKKEKSAKEKPKVVPKKEPKELTEIDKLEAELSAIESKLKSLT